MASLSIIGFYLNYETTYELYISYSAIMTEVNIISFQKLRMIITHIIYSMMAVTITLIYF